MEIRQQQRQTMRPALTTCRALHVEQQPTYRIKQQQQQRDYCGQPFICCGGGSSSCPIVAGQLHHRSGKNSNTTDIKSKEWPTEYFIINDKAQASPPATALLATTATNVWQTNSQTAATMLDQISDNNIRTTKTTTESNHNEESYARRHYSNINSKQQPLRALYIKPTTIRTTTTTTAINRGSNNEPCLLLRPTRVTQLCIITTIIISMTLYHSITGVAGVDCFKCSSRNGSNPACEDPFHNLNTTRVTSSTMPNASLAVVYHTPCMAGRKGRNGLFHASACIKLSGTFEKTGDSMVVRHCALDSGTLTPDTELARMSHCGRFQFEGDYLKGCVLSCPDDACNHAFIRSTSHWVASLAMPALSTIVWLFVLSELN
ncbi:hypothetical protein GZH46_01669 [Fragariocoptes setiger]|uniref:Protein quiver n=1 Tax=Fragariocoptes setiger TaxID=1670756 RepID=A0ABQ7S8N9_9ACAR|nr:hypothetical protein GZH46_01669 [Fragariocoptes setiger]